MEEKQKHPVRDLLYIKKVPDPEVTK